MEAKYHFSIYCSNDRLEDFISEMKKIHGCFIHEQLKEDASHTQVIFKAHLIQTVSNISFQAGIFFTTKKAFKAPLQRENERIQKMFNASIATDNAKKILNPGDRIRVTKCPGTKRTITFSHFDGCWIVSKSGINDYHSINVDMLNGKPVSFLKDQTTPTK